uniref:Uncharacterized protein n=1 Tax=Eutreptiella gymnastica TaxID=73025 RepID=A0A7S1IVI2_9EUGL
MGSYVPGDGGGVARCCFPMRVLKRWSSVDNPWEGIPSFVESVPYLNCPSFGDQWLQVVCSAANPLSEPHPPDPAPNCQPIDCFCLEEWSCLATPGLLSPTLSLSTTRPVACVGVHAPYWVTR